MFVGSLYIICERLFSAFVFTFLLTCLAQPANLEVLAFYLLLSRLICVPASESYGSGKDKQLVKRLGDESVKIIFLVVKVVLYF